MSSFLGTFFRVATCGESHGPALMAIVDGCPPGLALGEEDLQAALDRRRPGQSDLSTPRREQDRVEIVSGVQDGLTLGTPIGLLIRNVDQQPADYVTFRQVPRPSHADYTYLAKYGAAAASGGGRASARETAMRVAAGAIASRLLCERWGVEIVAWVQVVGAEPPAVVDPATVTAADVEAHPVRCPEPASAARFAAAIQAARDDGDSLGGVVACVARAVPVGWGEPVFAKCEALLAQAMLSLPASKGFEIGSGLTGSRMRGSEHNDPFVARPGGRLGTATNHSGGVQGGITNGEPILLRVAFKPPATIGREQRTADLAGRPVTLAARGRHDPCVVPRAVPIVEAMTALVLADLALQQAARTGAGAP